MRGFTFRPCRDVHPTPQPDDCRRCWLFVNREDYRRKWSGETLDVQPPGLAQKALNFAGAAVRHAASGFRKVPLEEQARRLSICMACPLFVGGACSKCGCKMKRKVPWKSARCPEKKW